MEARQSESKDMLSLSRQPVAVLAQDFNRSGSEKLARPRDF